jgi:hypothetical protein
MRDELAGSSEAEDAIGEFEPTVDDHEDVGDGLDQPEGEEPEEAV